VNRNESHREAAGPPASAFIALGAALLACIALLSLHPINAADTYLHLAAGRWILEHGKIPHQNLFMYTAPQHPWVDHTLVPQVVFVLIHRALGAVGLQIYVVIFYAVAFGLLLWLWRRLGVGAHLAAIPFLLSILLPIGRYAPRPELFTDIFLAVTICVVLTWREREHRWIWALPPLVALWVNCHGGVTTGLIFLWVFVVGEGLQAAIGTKWQAEWLPALSFRRWRTLLLAALAASVAVLLNPYGPRWMQAVSPSHIRFMATYIDEWRPLLHPGLQTGAALPAIFAFMGIAALSFVFSRRLYLSNLAAAVIFTASAFVSQRNIVICGLVLLGVMASNLSPGQPTWLSRLTPVAKARVVRPALAAAGVVLWLLVLGFAWGEPALGWLGSQRRLGIGLEENALPVRAERFLRRQHPAGRLFNTIDDGAYLAWKQPQGRPLFIDGLNAFGWPVVRQYREILSFGPRAEDLIARWKINTFLLPHPDPASRPSPTDIYWFLARSPQWHLVFWDGVSVIYLRDVPQNHALIERYGYEYLNPGDLHSAAYSRHPQATAAELRRATSSSKRAPHLRVVAGFIYLNLSMPDQATREFRAALRLAPDYADGYTGLGEIALRGGRPDLAEPMFRRAARLAPGDPAPHRGLAAAAQMKG